jgi:hypothetical protein
VHLAVAAALQVAAPDNQAVIGVVQNREAVPVLQRSAAVVRAALPLAQRQLWLTLRSCKLAHLNAAHLPHLGSLPCAACNGCRCLTCWVQKVRKVQAAVCRLLACLNLARALLAEAQMAAPARRYARW